MKKRRLALILLIVFLSAGVGVYISWKNAPGEEEYMAAALAYLEEQKAVLNEALNEAETNPIELDLQFDEVIIAYVDHLNTVDRVIPWVPQVQRDKTIPELAALGYFEGQKAPLYRAERIPIELDPQTGRVIGVHVDHPYTVDGVISWIKRATQVQRVKAIPELAYPHVYVGDKMTGNNEKLYYSKGGKILEFSLSETDSLGFLLYLSREGGAMYPEVKEAFSEGVIRQLKNEIAFGDQDVLTYSDGYLEAIDIKTPETAERLFECIRNCIQITDLTGACLVPMELPIKINGEECGTFDTFFATYQETGQFIEISFSKEDSENFYDYVMSFP